MIVIDVGCHSHGADSIGIIIRELQPRSIFGFDPHPDVQPAVYERDGANVTITNAAAWTYDGYVGFHVSGFGSKVDDASGLNVECFDLAAFIRDLPSGPELVLKLDCEGAEYTLLPLLMKEGLDSRLKAVWVEWHDEAAQAAAKQKIEDLLDCDVWEWNA